MPRPKAPVDPMRVLARAALDLNDDELVRNCDVQWLPPEHTTPARGVRVVHRLTGACVGATGRATEERNRAVALVLLREELYRRSRV